MISKFVRGIACLFLLENFEKGTEAVVNGWNAMLGEVPYQVHLCYNADLHYRCGAAIIDNLHILTSASCVKPDSRFVLAQTGFVKFNDKNSRLVSVNVTKWYQHTDYYFAQKHSESYLDIAHNIAIGRVATSFKFNDYVNFIQLSTETLAPHTLCQASRWGQLFRGEKLARRLQLAEIPIIRKSKCKSIWKESMAINPGTLCGGHLEGYYPVPDVCKYDEGNPLVCNKKLAGIVSAPSSKCGEPGYGALYTDVAYYFEWINLTLYRSHCEMEFGNSLCLDS